MNATLKATIQLAGKTIDHRIDQVNRNSLTETAFILNQKSAKLCLIVHKVAS